MVVGNSFGDRLKQKRRERSATLRAFCREIGFDPTWWSRVEKGIVPPPKSDRQLERMAEALGVEDLERFKTAAYLARGRVPKKLAENVRIRPVLPSILARLGTAREDQIRAVLDALGIDTTLVD